MKEKLQSISPAQQHKWNKRCVTSNVVENMENETEAIKEYYPLLHSLEDHGYEKAAGLVREIIADEKNHLLILQGILQEFDGNIPVADDNVQGALQKIKKAIEKDEDGE